MLLAPLLIAKAAYCGSPPPPGYVPPVIESVRTTPEQVAPGATSTLTVDASDDRRVDRVQVGPFTTPSGSKKWGETYCDTPTTMDGWQPRPEVSVDFTCALPATAPTGTWSVDVIVNNEYCINSGAKTSASFDVVGPADG